jgi:hypothetical protein
MEQLKRKGQRASKSSPTTPSPRFREFANLVAAMEAAKVKLVISAALDFPDAPKTLQRIQGSNVLGKIVLKVRSGD